MVYDLEDGKLEIDWKFWKAQEKLLHSLLREDHDLNVFQGGYRSGKSTTGARAAILNALRNPGTRNLVMGVTHMEAKQTTFQVLFRELPGTGIDPYNENGDPTDSPLVTGFSKQDKVLTFTVNGETSALVLGSADKADRYEGGSFDLAWCDEPGLYQDPHGVLDTLMERVDNILWTSTGKTGDYREIVEEQVDKDGNARGIDIEMTRANSLANPFLDKDTKQRLRRAYQGRKNYEMAIQGGFGSVEGRVYPGFTREKHVETVDLRGEDVEAWHYGYDAGWKDPRVVVETCLLGSGTLVVTDLFYESETHVEDAADWIQGKRRTSGGRKSLWCEHVPGEIDKLRDLLGRDFKVEKADKDLDSGIAGVRRRLDTDEDGNVGLKVDEGGAGELVSEFLGYREEDVGGSDVDDHCLDGLRYVVMGVSAGSGVEVDSVGNPFAV